VGDEIKTKTYGNGMFLIERERFFMEEIIQSYLGSFSILGLLMIMAVTLYTLS